MLGFVFGTVCLVALVRIVGRGRYGSACRSGRRRGFGGRGIGRSFFLRALFDRLDTTPGQERTIRAAIADVRAAARAAREDVGQLRADVARALRGDRVDETSLAEVTARLEAGMASMRAAAYAALANVHDVLDSDQRAALADLVESGFARRRRFGDEGPYRTAGATRL